VDKRSLAWSAISAARIDSWPLRQVTTTRPFPSTARRGPLSLSITRVAMSTLPGLTLPLASTQRPWMSPLTPRGLWVQGCSYATKKRCPFQIAAGAHAISAWEPEFVIGTPVAATWPLDDTRADQTSG